MIALNGIGTGFTIGGILLLILGGPFWLALIGIVCGMLLFIPTYKKGCPFFVSYRGDGDSRPE